MAAFQRLRRAFAPPPSEPPDDSVRFWSVGEVILSVYLTAVFAAFFFGLLALTQWLLTKWIGWQIILTYVLTVGGLVCLGVFLWSRLFARAETDDTNTTLSDVVIWTVMALGYSTVAFAALTAVLLHGKSVLTAQGVRSHRLAYDACLTYLWNLVDSIPVLNIANTFNWRQHLVLTNDLGRVFVLVYKLVLVVPLLDLLGVDTWRPPKGRGKRRDITPPTRPETAQVPYVPGRGQ